MKKTLSVAACLFIASPSFAGAYRLALQGQKALGMGHTGVAITESAEVVFFNPAGMAFLSTDFNITGGTTLVSSETLYQSEASNTASKTDNPIGTPLNLYLTKKYNKQFSYGLGLYTPYGNAVEWEKDWPGSHLVNNIELKAIFIQPTISFQFNEQLSIGFGPTYVNGLVEFNRNLSTSLADSNGQRSNVTIEASNIDAWGYNTGLLAKPGEKITLGLSYRSKINLKAKNESADFRNVPTSMTTIFPDTSFSADLILPAELTLGLSYNFNDTTLAFDFNRTFWSEYENLNVSFNNSAGTSLNPRNYKDSNAWRFGIQHKINDWFIRGGLHLDKTPIKNGYYTPETARNDSLGLTAGVSYKVSKKLELDFSFFYLHLDEFEGSYDFYEQSGTLTAFKGQYKTSAIGLGAGFNYKI